MSARRQSLEAKIQQIKRELAALGDLRPGKLSRQYNVCGNPACRCKANPPQKHGPYYQLSFTRKGKGTTQFVRQEDLAIVRAELRNYRRRQKLVERWTTLAMELSRWKLQDRHERGRARAK